MIDLNKIAKRALISALRRGKVEICDDLNKRHENLSSLYEEVDEVKEASEWMPSAHISDLSEVEEELIDVMIGCMTELTLRSVDIEFFLKEKIKFNERRKD